MFKVFRSTHAESKQVSDSSEGSLPPSVVASILQAAAKAPSGHNTQPWKFKFDGNCLRIFPDLSRALPIVDPENRELWISLGCAAECAVLAAADAGFATKITYPENDNGSLALVFKRQGPPANSRLFSAIDVRETNRSDYDSKPAAPRSLEALSSVTTGPNTAYMILTDPQHIDRLLFWINQGNVAQMGDPLFLEELVRWCRFNRAEAETMRDGLYSASADIPREVGAMLVENQGAVRRNQIDDRAVRSASGCILFATTTDDHKAWVETGRLYVRISLVLALEGMTSGFINQPIEIPQLRVKFDKDLGLTPATSQLLIRFGYAPAASRSYRRALNDLLV